MRSLRDSLPVGVLLVVAWLVFIPEKTGYGQSQSVVGQVVQCQPFQQSLVVDVPPGSAVSSGAIRVSPHTSIAIEQVALRIDADNYVAPAVAAVTTSVRSVTSAFYLPIHADVWFVIPARPLTLMQAGPIYADGGTNVALTIEIDARYRQGSGRAQWSISGKSCTG